MVHLSSGTHFLSDSVLRTVTMSVIHSHLYRETSRNPPLYQIQCRPFPSADVLCQLLKAKTYFSVGIKGTSMGFKWRLSLGLLFSRYLTRGSVQHFMFFLSDVTHRRPLSIKAKTLDIKLFLFFFCFFFQINKRQNFH